MGTRFLMTKESPVPEATLERYLTAEMGDIIVSHALDGLPQRMIANELARQLEQAGPIRKLTMALQNALALRRETGASIAELLRSATAMRKNQKLSNAQMILAANAPILARIAMSDGDPVRGYLPSGTVAGLLGDRPTCEALVKRIVEEAIETLNQLCP
jgi:NAD(P)H-dependent flavin oxidoreductase YrpB (nitropropane dioxygenase family)